MRALPVITLSAVALLAVTGCTDEALVDASGPDEAPLVSDELDAELGPAEFGALARRPP